MPLQMVRNMKNFLIAVVSAMAMTILAGMLLSGGEVQAPTAQDGTAAGLSGLGAVAAPLISGIIAAGGVVGFIISVILFAGLIFIIIKVIAAYFGMG